MIKLGLIGNPIAHSLSPEIHQGFIKEAEMQGSYDKTSTRSENWMSWIVDNLNVMRAAHVSHPFWASEKKSFQVISFRRIKKQTFLTSVDHF